MAKVTMPQLGESVAEGTIGKWLKQPGDHVAKYEPLLEVITDKVNAEVPSPFEGTLTEILVEEGATVPNNAEIAVIETAEGADAATAAAQAPTAAQASAAAQAPAAAQAAAGATGSTDAAAVARNAAAMTKAEGPSAPPETRPAAAHGPAGSDERRVAEPAAVPMAAAASNAADELPGNADARMTPAVRRLLREHGLTAAQIVGTGGGGRITREDVIDHVEAVRTGKPVGAQGGIGDPVSPDGEPGADRSRAVRSGGRTRPDHPPRRSRRSSSRPVRTRSSSR